MICKILGFKNVHYTNKAGKDISGVELSVMRKVPEGDYNGDQVDRLWIGANVRDEYFYAGGRLGTGLFVDVIQARSASGVGYYVNALRPAAKE